MRVFIKNKLFSIHGHSYVQDEYGNDVFRVRGKLFTFTRKKIIEDINGNVMFIAYSRFFNFFFHKAYVCDAQGRKMLSVRNKIAISNTFKVEGMDGNEYYMTGDFLSFNMTVYRNGVPIGDIHRDFNIIRDSFILDANPEFLPFLAALVIAIDNVTDDIRSDSYYY